MIKVVWSGHAADDRIRLIADGKLLTEQLARAASNLEWQLDADAARWYVVELRDQISNLRAVTHPIFINEPNCEYNEASAHPQDKNDCMRFPVVGGR